MTAQGLALHSTTGELGIALVNHQGLYRFQIWDLGRQLANQIQIKLAKFIQPLSWQDLDFIAVAKGPGSYTSTRIGVVTAKTLAQQLKIPVYGISTLIAIAWHHKKKINKGEYIAVEMKAHNEEIFGACYQFMGQEKEFKTIIKEARFTREKWQNIIENQEKKCPEIIKIKTPEKIAFTAENLLEIALIKSKNTDADKDYHWQSLTAFYE